MSVLSVEPLLPVEPIVCADDRVRQQVWNLLAGARSSRPSVDRRAVQRFPYPQLIRLTPVGLDGQAPVGPSVVVVGKHLSERGLGFYHPEPLPYRRMIATLRSPQGTLVDLLIDLTWCRFTEHGWYESGGRFLRPATLPPSAAA